MRLKLLIPLICIFVGSFCAKAQEPLSATKDPQAIAVLTQYINKAGGAFAIAAVKDFVASGTIDYNWGEPTRGSLKVRARGTSQLRLDSYVDIGRRSWVINGDHGAFRNIDGSISPIPFHNAVNVGILYWPAPNILFSISDPETRINFGGLVESADGQAYRIDVVSMASVQLGEDPTLLVRILTVQYFFDPSTLLLSKTRILAHTNENPKVDFAREAIYSNYRVSSGVLFPFSVTEKFDDQENSSMTFDSVAMNVGLGDSDFALAEGLDSQSN